MPIPDTLSAAIAGAVDPADVPTPESAAERMVFGQLYETLIRLDCTGAPRPGLAASWREDGSGAQWTFTLRDGAAFQDGRPVSARDVIAAWSAGDPALLAGASAEATDDRTVVVRLPRASPGPPAWLADPGLAVWRAMPDREWPLGSGPYTADTAGGLVTLAPFSGRSRPVVVLHPTAVAADARDWLDRGVDLLVTADPAALSYAADRPDLIAVALPWDRTYVLLAPGAAAVVDDALRLTLARDVVRSDARPAAAPFWWKSFETACTGAAPPAEAPAAPATRPVLVYPRDDRVARDLSERLVAVAAGAGAPRRAAGLADSDFTAALAAGRFAQYVIPLPRAAFDPCRAGRRLRAAAPWLASGAAVTPLVDTRRRAIVRRGGAAFTVEWDGTLRLR
jgi:Bacterial extracellular solute-binding proteins, family 5 Middle